MTRALFTIEPRTHRGWTVGVEGETDLPGFAVLSPDGEEADWFHSDMMSAAEALADRLNRYYEGRNLVHCRTCGRVVTSQDPEAYPYCRNCHYVGSAAEDLRAETLETFARLFPDARVGIEHTGGGCFWFAIRSDDWGDRYYVLTDGEASLPSDDEGNPVRGGWGYVGRHSDDEASPDYEGTPLHFAEDALADPAEGLSDEDAAAVVLADLAVAR